MLGLDEAPVTPSGREMTTQEWELIRANARQDLYFFVKGILGYDKLHPEVHLDLCHFLQDDSVLYKVALMPRSHFKTTVGTIGGAIWELLRNVNIRILLGNETAENAELMLAEIQQHFKSNDRFRSFFPEVVPKEFTRGWTRSSLTVPRQAVHREPSISAIGVSGAVVSRHFELIILDDIVGQEAFKSPTVMQDTILWLNRSLSLLVDPSNRIHLIGTRWAHKDVYGHAINNMGFVPFVRKAIVMGEDGPEPFFKARFGMEFFERIIKNDLHQWATQYANDPTDDETARFKQSYLRFYTVTANRELLWKDHAGEEHKEHLDKMRIYTHVDPSMGDTPTADAQGVITVGITKEGRVFILEAWKRRVDPLLLVEKLFEVHKYWMPEKITIEPTGFQKSLKYWMDRECRLRRHFIRVVPSRYPRRRKTDRIFKALHPYFSSGQVFLQESMVDLIEEYNSFGKSEDEHLLDALAQGPEFWKSPLDESVMRRYVSTQRELIRGPTGITGYGW